jgi:integrase
VLLICFSGLGRWKNESPSQQHNVQTPGLYKRPATLADGQQVVYYYAWRGGPRLPGEPGSPEFVAAYHEAHKAKPDRHAGTLSSVLTAYQRSPYFADKRESTRRDYVRLLRRIETDFGDLPLEALADRRVRGDFLGWRDKLAKSSRRQADYALAVLALILAWAVDRGLVAVNPLERPGRTYKADRTESVWTESDEAAFRAAAPPHLALALVLAINTGQRQGDLLRLTWAAYDGAAIRVRQSKTKRRVVVPCTEELRAALEAAKVARGDAVTILTTSRGTPWTSGGFRASWAKVPVELAGLTFHDLRGTAVTRLARAGCTVPEIATITGHALAEVESILDAHYLSRDVALAESAIEKLDQHRTRTKAANRAANRNPGVSE